MASKYTTLSALYVAITRLLDGDDVTVSELSTDSLDQLLTVAQQRIYRDVRSRWNEVDFAGATVVTNNLAPLPADFESASIVHFGRQALIPVSETVIRDYWADNGASANGTDLYFARAGNSLTFYPAQADAAVIQGRYFARLPFLTDATMSGNSLYQNADDLFIYACLVESADFFAESPKMAAWESKYGSIVDRLNVSSHRVAYSAGRLQQRGVSICGRGRIVRSA
jgi:hypothetical protein